MFCSSEPLVRCHVEDVYRETHQFARKLREAVEIAVRLTHLDHDVLSLDVTQFSQALAETLVGRECRSIILEPTYPWQFGGLLCRDGNRECGDRSACQRSQELSPSHAPPVRTTLVTGMLSLSPDF